MGRYSGVAILKTDNGKRYLKQIKYPNIPLNEQDIYIISEYGDTVDNISYEYYKNVDDYWIISVANNLKGDSRYIIPGTQIRIPSNTDEIKRAYNNLNKII